MNNLPYYRLYPKDFDTDENVRLMSMCEKGLYIALLNHSWVNGSVPNDITKIARIAGESVRVVKKCWVQVSRCFNENASGGLVNRRLEDERILAETKGESYSENAKKRWEKPCNGIARASESESDSSSLSSETQTTNQEKTSSRARGVFVAFEDFLHQWRRHRGFKKPNKPILERAAQKWGSVEITEDELAEALDGYYGSDWAKREGYPMLGFVKDPHSWRAGGLIENSPPPQRTPARPAIEVPVPRGNPTPEVSDAPSDALPLRDHPAEWNRMVPAAKYEWGRYAPIEALRLCQYRGDDFAEKFDEVCELAQAIHVARGKEVGWLTLPWILKVGDENRPNWYKLLTEMRWMATPAGKQPPPDPIASAREMLRKRKEERELKERSV
jgi:uncharacterized protein YdaU (DUF1376 family)